MIKTFRVKNYKALRDVELNLTPIHVLIGPNDSGKTSVLEALGALCRSVERATIDAFEGQWTGRELVWHGSDSTIVEFGIEATQRSIEFDYILRVQFHEVGRGVGSVGEKFQYRNRGGWLDFGAGRGPNTAALSWSRGGGPPPHDEAKLVVSVLSGVQQYRWEPQLLSLPVASADSPQKYMHATGFGLAGCLDWILGHDRKRFEALETRFLGVFPSIEAMSLTAQPAHRAKNLTGAVPILEGAPGKGIQFRLRGSKSNVPAAQMSDGVLLVLAYLTVLYLPEPPRVLMVEEPENGIHPARLRHILDILRELVAEQRHTQILMTTHSPYVLDMFKPEEVSLCKKESDGAVTIHQLSSSQTVRDQLDVFSLGEIWTSEGDDALAVKDGKPSGNGQ